MWNTDLKSEFAQSVNAEESAWVEVKGKLPGSTGFSQALWERWRETVARRVRNEEVMRLAYLKKTHPEWYG